jgi:hypothetical protein
MGPNDHAVFIALVIDPNFTGFIAVNLISC